MPGLIGAALGCPVEVAESDRTMRGADDGLVPPLVAGLICLDRPGSVRLAAIVAA
jgi:hypothetical protein